MEKLFFVVHTHWDREWYQPFQRMRTRLVKMTDKMLALVESGAIPHFHFDGQTITLEDYLEVRPGNHRRLAALVKAGRIAVGPWYVLADSFLVSGESLIRNLEIGLGIARRFGRPLNLGYLPDQFGHIAQTPQILAGFQFDAAVVWRGVPALIEKNLFLWEAPDGTRIPTIYLPSGYWNGAHLPLDNAADFVRRLEQTAAHERRFADRGPILIMNGTDHTIPDPRIMERLREASESAPFEFEVGKLEDCTREIMSDRVESAPVHLGELRSPARAHLLPGVTSARTWIKRRDFRNCAALERHAGPLAALVNLNGGDDALGPRLDLAWKFTLQNHPHDSICGCSIDQVHLDMRYRFDQAEILTEGIIRDASRALLGKPTPDAHTIAVFNPTFSREGLVEGEADIPDGTRRWSLKGKDGRRIPFVLERNQATRAKISFVADDLVQTGFSFYQFVREEAPTANPSPEPRAAISEIENEFYRITPASRGVRILHLPTGDWTELYFEGEGARGDEYNFDPVADARPITEPAESNARVLENGAVRKRIEVTMRFAVPESLESGRRSRKETLADVSIKIRATIHTGLKRIDFTADIDNHARDHRVRAALRTPVHAALSLSDTAFAVLHRPIDPIEPRGTEAIYPTAPHRTFTAVEGTPFAAVLMSRGIYETEVRREADGAATILLTLLRCVGWLSRSDLTMRDGGAGPEIETPGAQEQGAHRFEFAVTTFRGEWIGVGLMGRAATYAYPSIIFATPPQAGEGAGVMALAGCDNPRIMFSTAYPAPKSGEFQLRVFNASPEPERATLTLPDGCGARMVDLAGKAVRRAGVKNLCRGPLRLNLRRFEIVTVKVGREKIFRKPVKKD